MITDNITAHNRPVAKKTHIAPSRYPTMLHFGTEMCTGVHISVTKWYIVGYFADAVWDLWHGTINIIAEYGFMHDRHVSWVLVSDYSPRNAGIEMQILIHTLGHICPIVHKWDLTLK